MRQRARGSATDSDPYGPLFDSGEPDDEYQHPLFDEDDDADGDTRPSPLGRASDGSGMSRSQERRQIRKRGRGRVVAVFAALLVVIIAVAVWLVVIPVYRYLNPQDYSGSGSGSVRITVQANDGASDIARTLKDAGVVASTQSFTDAADGNSRSRGIQPGTYVLHHHMSGASALTLLLDPGSRQHDDVVVTEGATTLDVIKRMTAAPCAADASSSAVCGPGYDPAAVAKAFADVSALGIPKDFLTGSTTPTSAEGFLYPATYFFPESGSPSDALQQMVTKFAEQLRSTDFTKNAAANGFTPYQALIAASIAQSEAKYPEDMAKVVRVIMNRIKAGTPLRIDATSAYAAKLKGLDPAKVIYAQIDSPYNTYTHDGLPPTPISNPGSDALSAGADPADGNWLFYVNADAAGHLFFTDSEAAFVKAAETCRQNNWGCG